MPPLRLSRLPVQTAGLVPLSLSPLPLAPTLSLLEANWATPPILDSSWQTDVTESSESVAEERRGLAARPKRTLRVSMNGLSREESTQLVTMLSRFTDEQINLPLYTDQTHLTAAVAAASVELPCETIGRHFFPGGRLLVVHPDRTTHEYPTIRHVFPAHLEVEAGLANDYPADSLVFPLIDCELCLAHSLGLPTDAINRTTAVLSEVFGPSALPPLSLTVPHTYARHQGFPIFDIGPNWRNACSLRVVRSGRSFSRGRGEVVWPRGDRPRYEFSYLLSAFDRSEAQRLLSFLHGCRGRLRPWWQINPQVPFDYTGLLAADVIEIEPHDIDAPLLLKFFPRIAVVGIDGTIHVREVSHYTADQIHLTDPQPLAADEIDLVTTAHLVRFGQDRISETWHTDQIVEISTDVREILTEITREIPDVMDEPPLTDSPVTDVPNNLCWYDASFGVTVQASQIERWYSSLGQRSYPQPMWTPDIYLLREAGTTTWIPSGQRPYNNDRPTVTAVAPNRLFQFREHDTRFSAFWCRETLAAPTGCTIFAVFASLPSNRQVIFNYPDVCEWTTHDLLMYNPKGVNDPDNNIDYAVTPMEVPASRISQVFVMRWSPGVSAEVWASGVSLGVPVIPIADTGWAFGDHVFWGTLGAAAGQQTEVNTLALYNRALANAEVNFVANLLADIYGCRWSDLP